MNINSNERVKRAINRGKTDCIPVGPYMGNHCAIITKTKMKDYYTKAAKMADAQIKAWEIYGQDIVCVQSDNYYIVEGFGMKAQYHDNSTPTAVEPIIKDYKDILALRVPNPYSDGRMPVYVEAVDIVNKYFKKEVIVRTPGTGPFTMAGHLMGTEQFIMELAMIEHGFGNIGESAIHHLMELCLQALIEFGKAMLEMGGDIVQCADSLASLDMISPKIYEKFVLPYEIEYFKTMGSYARAKDAYMLLHICGNNIEVMEKYASTGADIVVVDSKSDLKTWKKAIGDKVALIGNLSPTDILLQGSVEEVREASKQCIIDAENNGGFILGSGCEVPFNAPMENIKEMIRTAREHKYI